MANSAPAVFGFLNAFKPPGVSSASFGTWARKRLGASAVGHWGTLDPAACGVLVLALGRATRLIPYLPSDEKSYVFELRVGAATDTADATGNVVRRKPVPTDWAASLEGVARSFSGELEQTPPMYSAVKVRGQALYKAARAGRDVERATRTVQIYRLHVIGVGGDSARMALDCSAGTYVRTLCEQIGERLGLPAHMAFLLRTRAGPFDLANARAPAEIVRDGPGCIVDPLDVLQLEKIDLDDETAKRFVHGNAIAASAATGSPSPVPDDRVIAMSRGALIGIGLTKGGVITPVRVLAVTDENG